MGISTSLRSWWSLRRNEKKISFVEFIIIRHMKLCSFPEITSAVPIIIMRGLNSKARVPPKIRMFSAEYSFELAAIWFWKKISYHILISGHYNSHMLRPTDLAQINFRFVASTIAWTGNAIRQWCRDGRHAFWRTHEIITVIDSVGRNTIPGDHARLYEFRFFCFLFFVDPRWVLHGSMERIKCN